MSTSDAPSPAMELMIQRVSNLMTDEGRQKAMNFLPGSTDVFIVTPGKTGTTWMQQIMHQLRSGGDMTFEDIDDVIPWIESASDVGQDLDAEQKHQPRCFKSHATYQECPKGGKYIVVHREPCATLYSVYKFLEGKFFQPGEITLDEFVRFWISLESNYYDAFVHLLSWWPKRNDENVLFLLYEDMLEDLKSAVRAVAAFMDINDEASILNAVKMSTFDFMKKNQHKFAGNRFSRYRNKAMGLADEVLLERVVTGSATKGREMMKECTKQAVQEKWNDTIAKETSIRSYDELRDTLKKEKQS